MKRFFIIFFVLLCLSCGKEGYDEFRAYVEPADINARPGGIYHVTVKIEIPRGSHIYGNPKGPGIGKATELTAAPQEQIVFLAPKFLPARKYFAAPDDDFVYIYENSTEIRLPFTIAENARPGSYNLSFLLDVLICTNNFCEPVKIPLSAELEIAADAHASEDMHTGKTYEIEAEAKMPEVSAYNDVSVLDVDFKPVYLEKNIIGGLLKAIFFGLLAGFILNFMPCVLPVVGIKIMGFVKLSGGSRRELIKMGGLFSAGILAAFSVLAALAAFAGYNWGALFQYKTFLVIMCSIVFLLALSMFGVFTLNVPAFAGRAVSAQGRGAYAETFVKGLLATLLATPCSGPLLGGTLAWAMTQRPLIIFVVFMSVGFGMALPYLLLCVFPRLLRLIPSPGNWLRILELVMGFLLVFTVVYLLSIFTAESRMQMTAFLAFAALASVLYGRFGEATRSKKQRFGAAAIAAGILAVGYFLSFNFIFEKGYDTSSDNNFSVARLLHNKNAGIISMVKFTADWCPNCKLVEVVSLNTEKVRSAVKRYNIDFMTADITRPFPDAEKLMHSLGSRSIPFLILLPAGSAFAQPVCLRDMYSEGDVLFAIEKVAKTAPPVRQKETGY